MMAPDTFIDVEIIPAVLNDDDEVILMAYDYKGECCITFAIEDSDGYWIPALFPQHYAKCEKCRMNLAASLAEDGFVLTHSQAAVYAELNFKDKGPPQSPEATGVTLRYALGASFYNYFPSRITNQTSSHIHRKLTN